MQTITAHTNAHEIPSKQASERTNAHALCATIYCYGALSRAFVHFHSLALSASIAKMIIILY